MLPPFGHAVNSRSCCSPRVMLPACLDTVSLLVLTELERWHGVSLERCQSGGAIEHGTGPWDDVTGVFKRAIVEDFSENFVDVDMNARMKAVDEWMVRRENQSMYWEGPLDAFQASVRLMICRSSRVTQRESDA